MKRNTRLNMILAAGILQPGLAISSELPSRAIFTPAQEIRIGEVARDYLLAHPEILAEVSQKLQAQQQEQNVKSMTAAVLQNQAELLNDKGTPSYGPADANVTIVEFFDYQCIYCARLASELKKVAKENPKIRIVFKEWPLLSRRWENSQLAAKTGLQVWKQKGGEAYLKYHDALYATGHTGGKLTAEDITKAARDVNFEVKAAPDVMNSLEGINALAQQLGFRGTPAVVVMPSVGATIGNVTVIPGYTDASNLKAAIDKAARGSAK